MTLTRPPRTVTGTLSTAGNAGADVPGGPTLGVPLEGAAHLPTAGRWLPFPGDVPDTLGNWLRTSPAPSLTGRATEPAAGLPMSNLAVASSPSVVGVSVPFGEEDGELTRAASIIFGTILAGVLFSMVALGSIWLTVAFR